MFIIRGSDKIGHWISGIFKDKALAEKYFESIPKPKKAQQQLVEIPIKNYPLYLIEEPKLPALPIEKDALVEKLATTVIDNDEDRIYFIYYVITEDFAPKKPGEDYMGALMHHHVDREHILVRLKRGMNVLETRNTGNLFECCRCGKLEAGQFNQTHWMEPMGWKTVVIEGDPLVFCSAACHEEWDRVNLD